MLPSVVSAAGFAAGLGDGSEAKSESGSASIWERVGASGRAPLSETQGKRPYDYPVTSSSGEPPGSARIGGPRAVEDVKIKTCC